MKYISIFILKNDNLITYRGILFLIIFVKNKTKLNIILLKLGIWKITNLVIINFNY